MPFGSQDEILAFAVGLQKDPSFDNLLASLPKDVKKKMGGGFDNTFQGIERSGLAMLKRLGAFAAATLGIGGAAAFGMRVTEVANVERATAQLGRSADLTREQEEALGRSMMDTALDTGQSRKDQIAALQLLQDRYSIVHTLADEGKLDEQMELAAKMANAFGMELGDVTNLMGSLNQLMGITGPELVSMMAFLEEAAKRGSLGFQELGQVFPDLLGEAKAFGEEGEAAVRTIGAMIETVTAFYKDQERARTYTRQALTKLSDTDVQKRLQSQLGVTVDETKSLRDIVQETLDALEGLGSRQEALGKLQEIFGSQEAVNAWKALLTERGTFENIITVEAGTKEFLGYLEKQNEATATEIGKFKERLKGILDQTILTKDGMANLTVTIQAAAEAVAGFTNITGSVLRILDDWAVRAGIKKEFENLEIEKPEAFGVKKSEAEAMDLIGRAIEYEPGQEMTPADQRFMDWYLKANKDKVGFLGIPGYYDTEEKKRGAFSEHLKIHYSDLPETAGAYGSEIEKTQAEDTVSGSFEALRNLTAEYRRMLEASVTDKKTKKKIEISFSGWNGPPDEVTVP